MENKLLNRKEAGEYLGVSLHTLAYWKCKKTHDIPTVKIGKLVKYRISDLERFVESRVVTYGGENGID